MWSKQQNRIVKMGNRRYPVPTGPPMPTVKALSLKSLVRSGGALLLKKPGEYMGSCECGASPSWLWYTFPSGPTHDFVVESPWLWSWSWSWWWCWWSCSWSWSWWWWWSWAWSSCEAIVCCLQRFFFFFFFVFTQMCLSV